MFCELKNTHQRALFNEASDRRMLCYLKIGPDSWKLERIYLAVVIVEKTNVKSSDIITGKYCH